MLLSIKQSLLIAFIFLLQISVVFGAYRRSYMSAPLVADIEDLT